MLHEWFGQGWSPLVIIIYIIFIGTGMIISKAEKTKFDDIMILLIPCILIILCDICFVKIHSYLEIAFMLVGGLTTLFLIGIIVGKIVILIKNHIQK